MQHSGGDMSGRAFHFMGIGGAGMSVVAELLLARGARISGCDRAASSVTALLESLGATVYEGHDASHLPHEATLVTSSAIREDNPELMAAREAGMPILHRSQALRLASEGKDFIAVAGAHGKTTTSAMIASAFQAAGLAPSWAIGASLRSLGAGGHAGTGTMLVAEADESDGSFLNYAPRIALVTNIENDHLDHYASSAEIEAVFAEFSRRVVPDGVLIVCADDDRARRLGVLALGEGRRVASYGRGEGVDGACFHVCITDESMEHGHPVGTVRAGEHVAQLELPGAVGSHNLLNAAGAWAVGLELGVDGAAMAEGLASFEGTGRRFEERGHVGGVRVIDDYAHHPTEVAATIRAAREQAQVVRVLFQPHLYSRTRNFAAEFAHALSLADDVIVTGVYAAREDPLEGVEGYLITEQMDSALFIPDRLEAAHVLAERAQPGDIVLTMGAGDVTELGPVILEDLA